MNKIIGYGFATVLTVLLSLQSVRFELKYSVKEGINIDFRVTEVNESVALAYIVLISGLLGVGAANNPRFNINFLIQLLTKYKKDK
jgi:hypothetical protein